MGFLSTYDGIKRVVIGDPERDYWIDLREHISQGEKESAERALQGVKVVDGKAQPTPDVVRSKQLMVLASIKEWNLDEDDGTIWPITLASIRRLPGDEFDRLWLIVDKLGEPASVKERRAFPGEGVGGDSDGDAGAAEFVDVPTGSGVVEETWPEA